MWPHTHYFVYEHSIIQQRVPLYVEPARKVILYRDKPSKVKCKPYNVVSMQQEAATKQISFRLANIADIVGVCYYK